MLFRTVPLSRFAHAVFFSPFRAATSTQKQERKLLAHLRCLDTAEVFVGGRFLRGCVTKIHVFADTAIEFNKVKAWKMAQVGNKP